MKDYVAAKIFCNCSAIMHCKGKSFVVYKDTSKNKKCPNCGRECKVIKQNKETKKCQIRMRVNGKLK